MMAVALYSVIKNNQKHQLDFYVLHQNISSQNISRLMKLENRFANTHIKPVVIDEKRLSNTETNNLYVTTEAYFRYLAPEILGDESRVLYMDFDMLCISGIKELYGTDLEDDYLGAVADYVVEHKPAYRRFKDGIGFGKTEVYFNSGLLLLNLEKIRKNKVMEVFWDNLRDKNKIIAKEFNFFADQTVMNLTFRGKIKSLAAKNNVFTTVLEDTKQKDPVIVHFTGMYKPLTYRNKHTAVYDDIYYTYYRECIEIIGDDGGLLVKNMLKWLSRETRDRLKEIEAKNHQLDAMDAQIKGLTGHIATQDTLIKSQNTQLNSAIILQKRAIRLVLERAKKSKNKDS